MPPKMTEQHKRDKSPDNKHDKGRNNSGDESTMEKLKDKMGGLFGHDDKDDKDEKNDPREQNEQDKKSRSRSRSRNRSQGKEAKNQGPNRKQQSPDRKKQDEKDQSRSRSRSRSQDRKGRNHSPDRKWPGAGPGQQRQQQPMKMGIGAGADTGHGPGGRGQSPPREPGQSGHQQNPGQSVGTNAQRQQSPGRVPGQPGHQQNPGSGVGPSAQKQHAGPGPPGAAAGARAAAGAGAPGNQKSRTKRGLCWPVENRKDDPSRFTHPGSKVSWIYNWSPHPTKGAEGLQFIPMQWNAGGIGELKANVNKTEAKTVLAFNEPELKDQANMSTDDAAKQWMEHFEPLRKQGVRCGSPSISSAAHGVTWLKEFWEKIKRQGSDVDFWCFHWYGVDIGPFYDYIWSTHHQLDPTKKVWITEFAATNWNKENPLPHDVVVKFARESFKYLDSLDWVERYCWFAPTRDIGNVGTFARLYNDEGDLTDVGKVFRDE